MASTSQEWRVIAASIFAVAAITGSYFLARGATAPRVAEASTESALLQQIATKDSTGDGLPDWQKALYGIPTNASTSDYFHLGMTDGEAVAKGLIVPVASTPSAPAATKPAPTNAVVGGVGAPTPNSLTDTFAQNFFALYTSAQQNSGGSLTSDQVTAIANQAMQQLSASTAPAPDFKTANDIRVNGTGPDALKAYASAAEQVLAVQGAKLPESELQYLQDYLNSDATALAHIQTLAAAYMNTATGLAAISAPQEIAASQLALVNALARVGQASTDFSHADSDPLAAMLALQEYPGAVFDMLSAFTALQGVFTLEKVVIPAGTSGAQFLTLISNISKGQLPSATKP